MQSDWQLADRNLQYRVLNALVKEKIWSSSTRITTQDNQLEIQLYGCVLTIHYKYVSKMVRYDFEGPITYRCGKNEVEITSLENLLDVLEEHFEIEISERLRAELLHSRDSFIEVYKHFTNRKNHIQDSLKFSRMPTTINFFAWLQHLSDSNDFNDLMYSESLVIEGHPTHPLTKTKLPLTMEEVKQYSPEFEKIIPLKIMLLHKDYARVTTVDGNNSFVLEEVIPEYHAKLRKFIQTFQLSLDDYQVIFVHPWQYQHTIYHQFEQWINEKILIATPFDIESKATLSFRTMSLINKPYHIKLPVNVQATSAVRTVSSVTTVDGPNLSLALQETLNQYPQLKVALEPFGIYANTEDDRARQLACIIREKPFIANNGATIVSGALVNPNPVDGNITVDSYIEWASREVNEQNISQFMRTYCRQLVTSLIALIQDYGIALEAHMQNTIVNLGPQFQMNFVVRDLGGSRIDLDTLSMKLKDINVTNTSLLASSINEVVAKFQHAVVQNQLAELIHHFSKKESVSEVELFKIVQEEIERAISDDKPHAETLREILFGPTITVKALLRMRMENKVKKYLNIDLDNPIKKEVN
nr:IucA/IucC family protein [Staphylococcus petrasii]